MRYRETLTQDNSNKRNMREVTEKVTRKMTVFSLSFEGSVFPARFFGV